MPRFLAAVLLLLPLSPALAEPPKTDQYGDPLPPGAVARLGTMRWRVGGGAQFMNFLNDGSIVTISDDLIGQVSDRATGRELRHFDLRIAIPGAPATYTGLYSFVYGGGLIAQSGDGKRLALAGPDRQIHLIDSTTGKYLKKVGPTHVTGFRLTLSHDGSHLAEMMLGQNANGFDKKGFVWDTTTDAPEKPLTIARDSRQYVSHTAHFTKDGKTLVQLGMEFDPNGGNLTQVAVFWDVVRGEESRRLTLLKDRPIAVPAISPDLRTVAIPVNDAIRLVDLAEGKEISQISAKIGPEYAAYSFTPDGKALIRASGPGMPLTVWEIPSGKILRHFDGLPTALGPRIGGTFVVAHAISADGKTLAWAEGPGLTLIDLETGKVLNEPLGHTGPLREALFRTGGREVMTRSTDGRVIRWDPETGHEVGRWEVPSRPSSCQVTADGKWFVTLDTNGAHVIDTATLTERHQIHSDLPRYSSSWGVSPDGKHVANTARGALTAVLFDIATGQRRLIVSLPFVAQAGPQPYDGRPRSGVPYNRDFFSRDGRLFGVASEGFLTIWDVMTGRQVGQVSLAGLGTLRSGAISADGSAIALETSTGVAIWEMATGVKRLTLIAAKSSENDRDSMVTGVRVGGNLAFPSTLAYSPDDRLLVRAGEDRIIRYWDTWTGTELGSVDGHRGAILSVAFSPDGRRLVSASTDSTALVWDVDPIRAKIRDVKSPMSASDAEALWPIMADADATKAFAAMRKLAGDPERAVALLRGRVKAAAPADAAAVAKWIAELGDAKYSARQKAEQELARVGERAGPALRRAAESDSPEVRRAAQKLLDRLSRVTLTTEQLRAIRSVEALERIGTPAAVAMLKELAAGADEVAPTPQARESLRRSRGP